MMLVAVVMLLALSGLLRVSKIGLVVRAALTHRETVETLGHDVPSIFTLVFAIGTALAALAGVIGAPLFVIEPSMADTMGPIVFVVVVIGGLGSLVGALLASLLVGCLQTFAIGTNASLGSLAALGGASLPSAWASLSIAQIAPVLPYALLVAMLALSRGDLPANVATMRSRVLPWLLLVATLALPPVFAGQGWLLAYLAQTATIIVFALSFNLLLGDAGLLSFGHAVYSGLGAFAAAQVFNLHAVPLPLLPLVGRLAAALVGVVFGFISTRRAGTTYAMITLGLGELVAAGVSLAPGWFGGEGGVVIDRASAHAIGAWTSGPRVRRTH